MKSKALSVSLKSLEKIYVGEICSFHPHFIFDPMTGEGKLFRKDSAPVRFIRADEDPSFAWIENNPNSLPLKVRRIQLFKPQWQPPEGQAA